MLDLIKYKWENYGFKFHLIGFFNHMLLLILLITYNIRVYINDNLYTYIENKEKPHGVERIRLDPHGNDFAFILLIGIAYPFIYLIF